MDLRRNNDASNLRREDREGESEAMAVEIEASSTISAAPAVASPAARLQGERKETIAVSTSPCQ